MRDIAKSALCSSLTLYLGRFAKARYGLSPPSLLLLPSMSPFHLSILIFQYYTVGL